MSLEQSDRLMVQATVPTYMASGIGGAQGPSRGMIDFQTVGVGGGDLSRSLEIAALSTLPYEIDISTENEGRLRRQAGSVHGIRYTMSYANVAVVHGNRVICASPPVPNGRSDRFVVTLNSAT